MTSPFEFPHNGGASPEMIRQAMMRQQAPRPPDISTFRDLTCICGNTELEPVPGTVVKFNPLAPGEHVALNFQRLRCAKCGMYPVFEDKEWKFQAEPPPIQAV